MQTLSWWRDMIIKKPEERYNAVHVVMNIMYDLIKHSNSGAKPDWRHAETFENSLLDHSKEAWSLMQT